jgi:hypothetical protein
VKISSISTVHRPTPRTAVSRSINSSSLNRSAAARPGTSPAAVFSAISRMLAIFPPLNPLARIASTGVASTAAGVGNRFVGNNARNLRKMESAAFPFNC